MARRCVIAFLALTLSALQAGSPQAAQNSPAPPTPEAISDLRARLTAIEHDLQSLKDADQGVNADLRSRLTGVEHDFQALKDSDHQTIDAAKDGTQKDLSSLREQIASLDKRIGDVHDHTGDLNLTLTIFAGFLTFLGVVGGVAGYFSFGQRAREQAAEAAEKWLAEHAAGLKTRIDGFDSRIEELFASAKARMEAAAGATEQLGKDTQDAMARMQVSLAAGQTPVPSADERQALRETEEALKAKAERDYTADDWSQRAFAAIANQRFEIAAEYFGEAARGASTASEQAQYLFNRAIMFDRLHRPDVELAAYDELIGRFQESTDPAVQEQIAKALFNKGVALGALGRGEDAIAVYDDLIARFKDAGELPLREQLAKALFNKGVRLGALGRGEEEIAVYDDLIARFEDAGELPLREQLAKALFNKGVRLGALGRGEEEIAVYDDLIARFKDAGELPLREQLAMALLNKGVRLGALGRGEDAIAVYDDLIARFKDAEEPALKSLADQARAAREASQAPRQDAAG